MTFGQLVDERIESLRNPSWWTLLIAIPWTLGIVVCLHGWWSQRQVAARQQATSATIVEHQAYNHNQYAYVFTVGAKRYTGLGRPETGELQIGEVVRAYYDPLSPSTNSLIDFHDTSLATFGPVPLMTIGVGAVFILMFLQKRKPRTN